MLSIRWALRNCASIFRLSVTSVLITSKDFGWPWSSFTSVHRLSTTMSLPSLVCCRNSPCHSPLLNTPCFASLNCPRLFSEAKQGVLSNGEWQGELRQQTRDGRDIVVESRWTLVKDDQGQPKSLLVINTDVTDKRKIEAQFLRAQRMESIGTLASGIAHDFNNLLSPIMMSIQLLQARITDEDGQRLLAMLQVSAERGAGLVKQVLSFARGVEGERITLQPRHLIKEIVKILKDTLPKSIEVEFEASDDISVVAGDDRNII